MYEILEYVPPQLESGLAPHPSVAVYPRGLILVMTDKQEAPFFSFYFRKPSLCTRRGVEGGGAVAR